MSNFILQSTFDSFLSKFKRVAKQPAAVNGQDKRFAPQLTTAIDFMHRQTRRISRNVLTRPCPLFFFEHQAEAMEDRCNLTSGCVALGGQSLTVALHQTAAACPLHSGDGVLGNIKGIVVGEDMRTLPLVPFMRERLLTLKEEQQENRRLCGRSYIKEYLEYVCVNEIGDLIKPHYVTESFPKLLKAKGMRQIRYHDLRHSCASLLLANGVPMKQIQEWLGHSDFSTTANIYAHLDYSSKLTSADAMLNGLGFAQN